MFPFAEHRSSTFAPETFLREQSQYHPAAGRQHTQELREGKERSMKAYIGTAAAWQAGPAQLALTPALVAAAALRAGTSSTPHGAWTIAAKVSRPSSRSARLSSSTGERGGVAPLARRLRAPILRSCVCPRVRSGPCLRHANRRAFTIGDELCVASLGCRRRLVGRSCLAPPNETKYKQTSNSTWGTAAGFQSHQVERLMFPQADPAPDH